MRFVFLFIYWVINLKLLCGSDRFVFTYAGEITNAPPEIKNRDAKITNAPVEIEIERSEITNAPPEIENRDAKS